MGYPAPVGRGTLRRVAGAAQHRAVADVEGRTTGSERHDVIDRQVRGSVRCSVVARAPVAMLATPGAEQAGTESLPGPRAVEGVVPAAVGLTSVLGATATRAAGDDTTDRAQLHPQIVGRVAGAVYSPAVLRLRDHQLRALLLKTLPRLRNPARRVEEDGQCGPAFRDQRPFLRTKRRRHPPRAESGLPGAR
jgi:hypothetical protein